MKKLNGMEGGDEFWEMEADARFRKAMENLGRWHQMIDARGGIMGPVFVTLLFLRNGG